MTRTITPAGLSLIERNEGLRLESYRDPAGILTIGYGHTGPEVVEGLKIELAQADSFLRADLARFESAVEVETRDVPTTDDQFSAMVSLAYNIGEGAFRESSVLRLHRVGDNAGAARGFLAWDKAHVDGKLTVLPGLARRRQEERALYLSSEVNYMPDPASASPVPQSAPKVNLGHVATGTVGGVSATAMLANVLAYAFHMPAGVSGDLAGLIILGLGSLAGVATLVARHYGVTNA